jgi:hypothetical protein
MLKPPFLLSRAFVKDAPLETDVAIKKHEWLKKPVRWDGEDAGFMLDKYLLSHFIASRHS